MKPMLAAKTDGNDLNFPVLASPKYDGVRCLIIDGMAVSRSLKPIPNKFVQMLLNRPEFEGLDGELIIGDPTSPDCFNVTSSGVMTRELCPNFKFYIFDKFNEDKPFYLRSEMVGRIAAKSKSNCLIHVKQFDVRANGNLHMLEAEFVNLGFEGIMIRDPNGVYKFGRSTVKEGGLLKMKRFSDAEAMVIGSTQLMTNTNEATIDKLGHTVRSSHKAGKIGAGVLGSLVVKDQQTGVEFELGTGFTATDRARLWCMRQALVGKLVKYRYQPAGVKDKPRFPTFVGFRDERDI